jgi:hypothetical protein
MYKVAVEQAVGLTLGHDITKIIPGHEKFRAFKKGHVITSEDIPDLKDMGKEHIYIWEASNNLIHEDEAALRIAAKAAGDGISWTQPNQGRVNLIAEYDGILNIQIDQLTWLNNLDGVVFATIHSNRTVVRGQMVAGTRVVPIAVEQCLLEEAERLCSKPNSLITTGTEVNSGRIKDGFAKVIRRKIAPFGGRWMGQVIVPDDAELISREIMNFIAEGAQLVLVTGGMSVDPDDATPKAIARTGAEVVFYGAPVLPGSQFMLAYQGNVPICGVPGGALFNRHTTLDLLLPRIFTGERINRSSIAALGHGGLCENCSHCHYPACPFGKATYL